MNNIWYCVAVHYTDIHFAVSDNKLKCWHLLLEYTNAFTWLHFPHTENQLKYLHLSFSSSASSMQEAYILTLWLKWLWKSVLPIPTVITQSTALACT